MNSKQINELVKKNIPSVEIQSHKNFLRHDCLQFLDKDPEQDLLQLSFDLNDGDHEAMLRNPELFLVKMFRSTEVNVAKFSPAPMVAFAVATDVPLLESLPVVALT